MTKFYITLLLGIAIGAGVIESTRVLGKVVKGKVVSGYIDGREFKYKDNNWYEKNK